ncbi:MAG: glycoside hydrolase family 3 C-terminal domain-containing protein [Jatrophihabitans sp.]
MREGGLDEAVLDTSVARVISLATRGGPGAPVALDLQSHHRLARDAAARCAVLLKNEHQVLPLRPQPSATIAVIGEFARTPRFQGAGSSQVNPTRVDAALSELQAGVPDGVTICFAAGFGLDGTDVDAGLTAEAISIAQDADVVLAFLGLPARAESEGFDRTEIDLPANQLDLLERLGELTADLVVVLTNGSAVRTSTWEAHTAAILECWLPGQAGGGAIADLLLGVVSPSGRLAETIPVRLTDNPASLNFPGEAGHVRYGEGVFVGYRGYDATEREVSYPFGHGLSYTSFEYRDLRLTNTGSAADGDLSVAVTFEVANVGGVPGSEVAQVYLGDPDAAVARPPRELRAFQKATVQPGESAQVTVHLTTRDFSYWSTQTQGWALEGGEFVIEVGASSRDIRLRESITVEAPGVAGPLTADSSLEEWLTDPAGGAALRSALAGSTGGTALEEPGLLDLVGNFPMSRLATMPNMALSREDLDALLVSLDQPAAEERP